MRLGPFILLFVLAFPENSRAQETLADRIARALSPTIREMDDDIAELRKQLNRLPSPERTPPSARIGIHSETLVDPDEPLYAQVDLGAVFPIDSIALVPVNVDTPLYPRGGYGFPVRFKVETALTPDFSDPQLVADHTSEDFPNPGPFPVVIPANQIEARHVRITVTRHYPILEHYVWALSELIVLSGNRNVAAGRPVQADRSANFPSTWTNSNLTDSQSSIGIPLTSRKSPTNGWLGKYVSSQDETKWVQVDLKSPVRIDEFRLIPAYPTDMPDVPGMGFPNRFQIEGGTDPDPETWSNLAQPKNWSPQPGNNPVVIPGPDEPVRYVRVTAERLWRRGRQANFGLAEFQAYAGDQNVALRKPVTASDTYSDPDFQRWSPKFLVDGFASQYRLTEWPDYLEMLDQRRVVSQRLRDLRNERNVRAERLLARSAIGAGGFLLLALAGSGFALWRIQINRRRESVRLREQIARDLHDDIGSNLGGIALISDVDAEREDLPEDVRQDLGEIREIAQTTSESMRDIVWLIQGADTSLSDLVLRLRDAVHRLVGDTKHTLVFSPDPLPDRQLDLGFRRHFFFAFKETLHNIKKHAEARNVDIAVELAGGRLRFHIRDDGLGFDEETVRSGHGLRNLRDRAERLGGSCEIVSEPKLGTTVLFSVPLK